MKRLGVADAPVVCLINPRSFDADIANSAKGGKGSEQSFLKEFANYWKAVDGVALSVNLTPDIEVGLSLNVRKADLPKAAAKFLTEAGKRTAAVGPRAGRCPIRRRRPDPTRIVGRHARRVPERKRSFKGDGGDRDATRPFLETEDLGPLLKGSWSGRRFWIMPPDPAEGRPGVRKGSSR